MIMIAQPPESGSQWNSQIKKTSNNQFRFNIVASNGQVLATSETHVQKVSAVSTIESIKKNVAGAAGEDLSHK